MAAAKAEQAGLGPVSRGSSGPLYEKVKERLRALIVKNGLAVGDKLPTIRELCDAFGVSHQTITRALDDLAHQGVVHRVQGKGILVARTTFDNPFDSLVGLTEALAREGLEVGSVVVSVRDTSATAEGIRVFEGHYADAERLVEFKRVRSVAGVPAVFATTIVPASLGGPMKDLDLSDRSFYDLFAELTGQKVGREDHVISMLQVEPEVARRLAVPEYSHQFYVTGETYLRDGRPVEVSASVFRSDMFRFKVKSYDFAPSEG